MSVHDGVTDLAASTLVLVLTVHCWPAPVSVSGLLGI